MRIFFILFLFFSSVAMAQEKEFVLKKPAISSTKTLTATEAVEVKDALTKEGRLLIDPRLTPTKNDYVDDFDRGTVKYNPKVRNYSFQKVIIPDGTTITETNFTQNVAGTDAIVGEDLIFIGCNLVNVKKHDSWELIQSNNFQTAKTIKDIQNEESNPDVIK